jgi:2-polyprenyl-6-methoxyphenol hydroxylase-like FAD-dependent oxidoreductase
LVSSGGPLEADLVIDCGGRRSAVPAWIEAAGGVRPAEEAAEYGIAYWTQWFRLHPGASMPVLTGRPAVEIGPIEVLRAAADNGWFSITVVAAAEDKRFRVLSDQTRLLSFLRALDLTREWVDPTVAEPVGRVLPMFTVVDQRRRFVVDGRPCATGIVAVGDSVGATNPSLARGTTFALMHAVWLRDLLRQDRDLTTIGSRYEAVLEELFEPWWQATIATDQAHLARMRAAMAGSDAAPDPGWTFLHAAHHDPDLWRAAIRVAGVLELPHHAAAGSGVVERVRDTIARIGPPRIADLDVDGLLAL